MVDVLLTDDFTHPDDKITFGYASAGQLKKSNLLVEAQSQI